jgi:hypothetical protein
MLLLLDNDDDNQQSDGKSVVNKNKTTRRTRIKYLLDDSITMDSMTMKTKIQNYEKNDDWSVMKNNEIDCVQGI